MGEALTESARTRDDATNRLIEQGHAFLAEGKTRGPEVTKWKRAALRLLKAVDDGLYEQRREEFTGFTAWAASAISERAGAMYINRTLDALEQVRNHSVELGDQSVGQSAPSTPNPERDELLRYADSFIRQGVDYQLEGWNDVHELEQWMTASRLLLSELGAKDVPVEPALEELKADPGRERRWEATDVVMVTVDELVSSLGAAINPQRISLKERRLIGEAAAAVGVDLPRTITKGADSPRNGHYAPFFDKMVIPDRASFASDDEFKSTVGHELGHKKQNRDTTILGAYASARSGLQELARQLARPNDSLPLHLQATTMLAGMGAYATFVLLGKTVGYQLELEADQMGARASSPEAAASAMRAEAAELEAAASESTREMTWAERVVSRVAYALEDDHPTYATRINRVLAQRADLDHDSRTR